MNLQALTLQLWIEQLLERFDIGGLVGLHVSSEAEETERPVDAEQVGDGSLVLVQFQSLQQLRALSYQLTLRSWIERGSLGRGGH